MLYILFDVWQYRILSIEIIEGLLQNCKLDMRVLFDALNKGPVHEMGKRI